MAIGMGGTGRVSGVKAPTLPLAPIVPGAKAPCVMLVGIEEGGSRPIARLCNVAS